jgi:hypothetical protein
VVTLRRIKLSGIGQPEARFEEEMVQANRKSPCRVSQRRAESGKRKRE